VVRDYHGYRKRRPAIILTPDNEIADDQPLTLLAITTTYSDPPPRDCVELPWNHDRRKVVTGLARRSAAVLSWLDIVYPDEIEDFIGSVPSRTMKQILDRLQTFEDEG